MTQSAWWSTFYDEHLSLLLLQNTDAQKRQQTLAFLREELVIVRGTTVFDQCCGEGRLSLPLASDGAVIYGVDQAAPYIEKAKEHAPDHAHFCVGDAFQYTTPELCAAGFNWWTSFGYADSDETNREMIRRAFESLESGAKFALDFLNVPNILRDFQPSVVTRAQTDDGEEVVLVRASSLDFDQGVLLKTWTYFLPDGARVEHTSRVRLYLPDRIAQFFGEVGFDAVVIYGDIDRSRLTARSPRCIVVGKKP